MKKDHGMYRLLGQMTSSDTFLSLAVVGLLVLMIVPMNPFMLDFFLAGSIAASFGILLMAIYQKRSAEFGTFPTVLLLVTLYRLALNVASARLILSNGKMGTEAAGALIATFGQIVIHGNTFVGVLIFLILNVINFIVITKGAGRISEVAARFMLDALPGKQMSIDADLKAGSLSSEAAQLRRQELDQQADFYGAMDGASKFVKGDAIAGLVITGINILGGLFVGIGQEGMTFGKAVNTYTLLTIGDGLVTQFPALIVSTAAGIIVTKASSSKRAIGEDFTNQVIENPRVFFMLSIILVAMGIFLSAAAKAFLSLAAICLFLGFWTLRYRTRRDQKSADKIPENGNSDLLIPEAAFQVVVGLGLARQLYEDAHLREDLDRFVEELSQKEAKKLSPIRIADDMEISFFSYRFLSESGVEIFSSELRERNFYLLLPNESAEVDFLVTYDPLLKRSCAWIASDLREEYVQRGFVVVSASEVFRWHLFLAYRDAVQTKKEGIPLTHGSQNL